jgi:peptide/nickel transport system substrate-binding protein
VEAPDDRTVVFHLKQADNFLLRNLATGAIGIVPEGSGHDFWRHPVGTGPFRFVSQQIDQDVAVERNPFSWSASPKIERVRFAVVPDAITQALELEKGSADLTVNSGNCRQSGNANPIPRIQHTRSALEASLGAEGRCLRHRSETHYRNIAARTCAACAEPAARQSLGVDGRGGAI